MRLRGQDRSCLIRSAYEYRVPQWGRKKRFRSRWKVKYAGKYMRKSEGKSIREEEPFCREGTMVRMDLKHLIIIVSMHLKAY